MWGYVAELPLLSTSSLKEVAANDVALAARRAADAADARAPPPPPPPPVPPSRPAGRKGSTSRGTMPSGSWLPPPPVARSSMLENGVRENARAVAGPAVAGAAVAGAAQPDTMAAGLAAATAAATAAAATTTATTGNAASLNLGDGLVVGGYGCFLINHLHRGLDVRLGTSNPDPYNQPWPTPTSPAH